MAATTTARARSGHRKERVLGNQKHTPPTQSPRIERFPNTERKPQEDWLVRSVNEYGEREVYLRVQITGLFPRRFGPFKTDRDALIFLDRLCSEAWDAYNEALNHFEGICDIKEDTLVMQHLPGFNEPRMIRSMNGTRLHPTKPGSTTLENWKDLLFLVREPNRKGQLTWFIRAIVGEFAQVRYGPYDTEKEARAMFTEGRKLFDQALGEALCEFDHGGEWEE